MVLDDTPAFPAVFLWRDPDRRVPGPAQPPVQGGQLPPPTGRQRRHGRWWPTSTCSPRSARRWPATASPSRWSSPAARRRAPTPWTSLLAEHAGELAPAPTHRDDMAFWLYSGGSTGLPKGVVHLQHDIAVHLRDLRRARCSGSREGDCDLLDDQALPRLRPRQQPVVPVLGGRDDGAAAAAAPPPTGSSTTVERHRPTLFFSVPTLYGAMLATPEAEQRDLSSVRLCVSAAEPLPAEVWRRWQDTLRPGHRRRHRLHRDAAHLLLQPHRATCGPGPAARPCRATSSSCSATTGEPVPKGEAGNLYVRGDSALAGYWHQHDKTKADDAAATGSATGDRYRQDDDGFYVATRAGPTT